ncbi:E3 ubiquitin-protein ligase ORTHRUS-LIKE 1 isoform X1 [Arabidopsis lyrata subsp. lyrata]|uniref:E3 ubiquitin-protein ligase ORTHRUS-LIKE 1 isoform X1 n=1 Tax=Arabidopsis lyrata subsp. lyrata TaxID=81972 RepID=UPI000A29EA14|nr:E3 ubiquitin-protein ligase ORTHRUS-LIKE 1 isoform X1 [Arabidopsis lyrata subsp. lyrata]|eukprot:XP_020877466.1 E3 ubiquitin-protein ligase ORTHRUS-LIKE 1 isoform X1 [Arabidopsis lyrata subsp. lyrata]
MARDNQLPGDGDGVSTPEESLTYRTCDTPSHVTCVSSPPLDRSGDVDPLPVSGIGGHESGGSKADESMIDTDETKKRKRLLSGEEKSDGEIASVDDGVDVFAAICEDLNCSLCNQLPDRPVTTQCGHNFCLKCFEKWIDRGNETCAKCRSPIPDIMAGNPRVNSSLVPVIRYVKVAKGAGAGTANFFSFTSNQGGPENAFRTKRAKTGRANAACGRIYVTVPFDHFGPIPAENDPVRNQGVLVGESWKDRVECRQWGAHFAHVSCIAGQSDYGAQSVAISGGYKDDVDHGEWFLFTGRLLSLYVLKICKYADVSHRGRRNFNNEDQEFEELNEALRVSCEMGYPVRVVRSYKEKHSAYAPEEGVRYDGVYRIEKCWRKARFQDSCKVCRYLFVRCDNEPAPWNSDENGDRPRPLPDIPELETATDLFERKESPSWDFDEAEGRWRWMKPPPANHEQRKRMRIAMTCLLLFVMIIFVGSSSILYRV